MQRQPWLGVQVPIALAASGLINFPPRMQVDVSRLHSGISHSSTLKTPHPCQLSVLLTRSPEASVHLNRAQTFPACLRK